MRTIVLSLVVLTAAACGEAPSSKLVSADSAPSGDDGCVAAEARAKRSPTTWPTTWIVRDGDSLRRIARRCYGDENLWKAIADANPGKVGRDDVLRIGDELTIPYDGI